MTTTQAQRTRWRQRVMECGGSNYLLEKSRLFEHRERLICPTVIGLPRGLELLVWLHEREHPEEPVEALHCVKEREK